MPEPMVQDDIEAGRLVRLNRRDRRGGQYAVNVVHKIKRTISEVPPPKSMIGLSKDLS